MKVSEILVEETKLDELAFAPIGAAAIKALNAVKAGLAAGALTFPVLTTWISAALSGWTVVELVQFVSKYASDPEEITDWESFTFDLILALSPMFGGMIIKAIPDALKRKLADWVKSKILNKWRTDNAAKYAAQRSGITDPKELRKLDARERLANMKAKKKADALVNKLPNTAKAAFVSGIGLNLVHDYYTKISKLNDEWEAYKKGDPNTMFGTDTEQEALLSYNALKRQYLGEFTAVVGIGIIGIGAMKGADLIKFVGNVVGKWQGTRFVGGIFKTISLQADAAAAMTRLIAIPGFSFALFAQTESGKKFLTGSLTNIVQGLGSISAWLIDLLQAGIKEVGEKYGIKVDFKPTIAKPPADELKSKMSNKDYLASLRKNPPELRRTTDPNNPKIIYIGGVQFTDKDGYQYASDYQMNDIKVRAKNFNLPDPTAGIVKRPG
jgi:hypothetical protein